MICLRDMRKQNLLLSLFLLPAMAAALECPPNNAPLCPDSGSTLLDETYPTQAFVMSNGPSFKGFPPPSKEHLNVTKNYINTIVKSYDYQNVPQIMLALSTESEFEFYKKNLRSELEKKNINPDQIERIVGQLTHMKSPNYTWQQDYFESFVDLKTGKPVVRHIDSYSVRMKKHATTQMAATGSQCGIEEGDSIKSDNKSFASGEMGGNIEGAPGGFCLVGNNQGKDFTKSFCGKEENIINLNVSWLSVGHVDEIFKIVPNLIEDGRPRECKFSLMAASPQKALDLLKDKQFANRPFFDFPASTSEEDLEDLRDSRSNEYNGTNFKLCKYLNGAGKAHPKTKQQQSSGSQGKTVFTELLMSTANAEFKSPFKKECEGNVTSVSNEEMYEQMMNDTETLKLNVAIQESIDNDVAVIKAKILSRLPQCAKYFDVINVPNYFEGGPLIKDASGKGSLPQHGNVNAYLPNPTNSVLMNETLLFPDAGNSAYSDYLISEMKKRKVKSDFIATWDYAHLGMGNIHCSSHSLPYCKPRSKK